MIGIRARNDWVIIVENGVESDYFTLDGVYIGTISDGTRVYKDEPVIKRDSGVVRSLTPTEIAEEKKKQVAESTGYDERTPDTKKLIDKAVQR